MKVYGNLRNMYEVTRFSQIFAEDVGRIDSYDILQKIVMK